MGGTYMWWQHSIGVGAAWLGIGISMLVNAYAFHNGLSALVGIGIVCLILSVLTFISVPIIKKKEEYGDSFDYMFIAISALYLIIGIASVVPGYVTTEAPTPVLALTIPGFVLIAMAAFWMLFGILGAVCGKNNTEEL